MGLKRIYYNLEDRYFKFLENLENKGINLYKVIDPLEKKGIPTFPIVLIIILGLLVNLSILLFATGDVTESYSLTVSDDLGNTLNDQTFLINFSDVTKQITTDEYGISSISGLDKKEYDLSLEDNNEYQISNPTSIDLSQKDSFELILEPISNTITKRIELFSKEDNSKILKDIGVENIICSNTGESIIDSSFTIKDGSAEIEDVPRDCGELKIVLSNYSISNSDELFSNQKVGQVYLQSEDDIKKGNLKLILKDRENQTPLKQVSIELYDSRGKASQKKTTNDNGIVEFNNLKVDTYNIVVYGSEKGYENITLDDQEKVSVLENQTENRNISINQKIISEIDVSVIDIDTKEPITNVETTLYQNNQKITSKNTNSNGEVTFGFEKDVSYKLQFNHPDYILKDMIVTPNQTQETVELLRINQENYKGLEISIKDTKSNPVEYCNIDLIDNSNNRIISQELTDIEGKVVFNNLDPTKSYQIKAYKKDYSITSNPFRIEERKLNKKEIVLDIGESTYQLNVTDSFSEKVQTQIKVYDAKQNREITNLSTKTSKEGNTLLRIRADKTVFFVIDNSGTNYITKQYDSQANTKKTIDIKLPKINNASNIEFVGLYDNSGNIVRTVSPGQTLKAKFYLNINSDYSEAIAHIRTGDGENCDNQTYKISNDNIYIHNINYAYDSVLGSTTYTPCQSRNKDLQNSIKKDAKWLNLSLKDPIKGTYLVEADIVVLNSVRATEPIYYRAEFYNSNMISRFPKDNKLLNKKDSSAKQGLYAYAKKSQIKSGNSTFCNNDLCYNLSIFDRSKKITRNIIDSFNGKENVSYNLYFNINLANKSYNNPELQIKSDGESIDLVDYTINLAGGNSINSDEFSNIDLVSLNANDHISGEINFNVINDISDSIKLNLLSDGQIVFSKDIFADIKPSKEMYLDLVPRTFVPFVANDVLINVLDSDDKAIKDASVNIELNDNVIKSGTTNNEGMFGFVIPSPNTNDEVEIIINKQGYKSINNNYKITDNVLEYLPKEIKVDLDLSKYYISSDNISLINKTALPFNIDSIENNLDNEYIKMNASLDNHKIESGSQIDLDLQTKITQKGLSLLTQKTFESDIIINLSNESTIKNYKVIIPYKVRVTFGNSLDDIDCLELSEGSITLRSDTNNSVEKSFSLKNNCKVDSKPVMISNLLAKLKYDGSGKFILKTQKDEFELENLKDTEVLELLGSDQEIDLTLVFNTNNLNSEESNPKIEFSAKRPNINGVDEISKTLDISAIVNNYSKCIKIPNQQISTLACYNQAGMNNYSNYYGDQFGSSHQLYNRYNNTGNAVNTPQGQFNTPITSASRPYYANWQSRNNYLANPNNTYNPRNEYLFGYDHYSHTVNNVNYRNQYEYNNPNQPYIGNQMSTFNPQNRYPNPQANYNMGLNNQNFNNFTNQSNPFMMNNNYMFGCSPSAVTIENSCNETVDIKLETDSYLTLSSDQEFTLEPGEKESARVLGGERMGVFNLNVLSRASQDISSKYKLTNEIPVNVSFPVSYMPSYCIQVSPKKIDFSFISTGYKEVDIINTCYSRGYRLVDASFKDIQALKLDNIWFLEVAENQGSLQPINVKILETGSGQNKEMIEKWTVALKRNPKIEKYYLDDYRTFYGGIPNPGEIAIKDNSGNLSEQIKTQATKNPSGLVSSLRHLTFDLFENINLKFALAVTLQTPELNSPFVTHDVGMEIKDNLQWLGLIQNIGRFTKDKEGNEIVETNDFNIPVGKKYNEDKRAPVPDLIEVAPDNVEGETLPVSYSDYIISDENKDLVIIKVDEFIRSEFFQQLPKVEEDYKFIDSNEFAVRCIKGDVSNFPIDIPENSYIPNDNASYFYNGDVDNKRVLVSIQFSKSGNYKLCFTRPLSSITEKEARVFAMFDDEFEVYSNNSKIKDIYIGVDANLDQDAVIDGADDDSETQPSDEDGKVDEKEVSKKDPKEINETIKESLNLKDYECSDPYGYKKEGYTGSEKLKEYGVDRILFDWDKIDESTCDYGNYYCDQSQLHKSIDEKLDIIKSRDYIEIDGVKFKEKNGLPIETETISDLNLKNICKEKTNKLLSLKNLTLDDYIDASQEVINKIPSPIQKTTIITFESKSGIESLFDNELKSTNNSEKGNLYFTTLYNYNNKMNIIQKSINNSDKLDEISKMIETMDIYSSVSLNAFVASLKVYGNLASSLNKDVLLDTSFLGAKYELNLTESSKDIDSPGLYYITLTNIKDNESANIGISKLDDYDLEFNNNNYTNNVLFYKPINPSYNNKEDTIDFSDIPFIENKYKLKDPYKNFKDLDKGYRLVYNGEDDSYYINLEKIFVKATNLPLSYKLIRGDQEIKDSKKWLYVSDNKVLDEEISYSKNGFSLDDRDLYFTTFFVLREDNFLENKDYQSEILSTDKLEIKNISEKDNNTKYSDFYKYVYSIKNKYNEDVYLVKDLVENIESKNMCFNINENEFKIWDK